MTGHGTDGGRWRVRHPGLGILAYDSEAQARVAAGTAGEVLPPDPATPPAGDRVQPEPWGDLFRHTDCDGDQLVIVRAGRHFMAHAGAGSERGAAELTRADLWRLFRHLAGELGAAVLLEVLAEQQRQLGLWGVQNHPDGTGGADRVEMAAAHRALCQQAFADGAGTWRHILAEEFTEALAESDPGRLRTELVQVAAVAASWAAAIDRRAQP